MPSNKSVNVSSQSGHLRVDPSCGLKASFLNSASGVSSHISPSSLRISVPIADWTSSTATLSSSISTRWLRLPTSVSLHHCNDELSVVVGLNYHILKFIVGFLRHDGVIVHSPTGEFATARNQQWTLATLFDKLFWWS